MASAASAPNENQASVKKKEDGFFGKRIRFFFHVIGWVIFALALSVLLEWVGIFFSWWKQPGALHSEAILTKELRNVHGITSTTIAQNFCFQLIFLKRSIVILHDD